MFNILPALRALSYLRLALDLREQHAILVSFDAVSYNVMIIIPFVYNGVLHLKFQKISDMLEVISHSSMLQYPDKYSVVSGPLH